MDRFKTIVSYRDLLLAEVAKSKLESEGIYCFLSNKYLVSINWLYSDAIGGVGVRVMTGDAQAALEILGRDQSSELKDIEWSVPQISGKEFCVTCGSDTIAMVKASRKPAALSLLLGVPLIWFGKRFICRSCGEKVY